MLIRDVMTRTVVTVNSTATVREAAQLMAEKDVGFLPVIHEKVSAGVITDRDIVVRVVAEGQDPDRTYVSEIVSAILPEHEPPDEMNAGIASLPEETEIEEAIHYMDGKHVRRVTVHDKNYRIIGVLSRADLPQTAAEATSSVAS